MLNRLTLFKPSKFFWNDVINSNVIITKQQRRFVSQPPSSSNTSTMLYGRIQELLRTNFPNANEIIVKDISGGCGSMFEVFVSTKEFEGMSKVKQHLTISNILKNEIKDMHGIRIFTEVPSGEF